MSIHVLAAAGDAVGLRAAFAKATDIDAFDERGRTALMVAAASPKAGVEVLQLLLEHGANVNALAAPNGEDPGRTALGVAAQHASLDKIKHLVAAGADVRFINDNGYSILTDAMHRSYTETESEHLALLDFLVTSGAPLDTVSKYGESVLSVASRTGDFEKVSYLLERGANPAPLDWTPIFFAIARGNQEEVTKLIDMGASLEERDGWERTPFLLAVHAGQREIAQLLLERGCDRTSKGRCGRTALMYVIERNNAVLLQWLISQGWDVEEVDEFGGFPLSHAIQENAVACFKVLLAAGASPSRRDAYGRGLLEGAESRELVTMLVAAGEDLSEANSTMRSRLTGIEPTECIDVSEQDFHNYRNRRFGKRNPEPMNNPYWNTMVRARAGAYAATKQFDDSSFGREPAWCYQRFGQSFTRMPDGRYVEIAGEHEDHYDPDFCIYNDVVVHHGDGTFDLFGYPQDVFPPTDFHSATFCAPYIYIIGNLGYPQDRRQGKTPVYRLLCDTWAIEPVHSTGDVPGWIHGHKAKLISDHEIEIRGGLVEPGGNTELIENRDIFIFNTETTIWTKSLSE